MRSVHDLEWFEDSFGGGGKLIGELALYTATSWLQRQGLAMTNRMG